MVYRILSITCVALGAIILIAVAGSILKAYQTSHEKQDLGHFFKMLVVGVVCAALGMGLVYAGYSIIPSQK
jgi:drug/metabolite transporter (DMT)-like permease